MIGSSPNSASGPFDEIGAVLAELPRPRPVRMTRRGTMMVPLVVAALLLSLGMYAAANIAVRRNPEVPNNGSSQFPIYFLSIVFIVVFSAVMVTVIGKQKRLLAEGEMAAAQVTKCWVARNGPNIRYEFTTPLVEKLSGSAPDGSRRLTVGMKVPVFYDPQNPKKQLALCASFYEVILPGKE